MQEYDSIIHALRNILIHSKQIFNVESLRKTRDYYDSIWEEKQLLAKTEKEIKAINRGETSDSLRLDETWYNIWRNPTTDLLSAIGPYTWVLFPPQIRFIKSLRHRVPWHQDIGYQRVFSKERQHKTLITCFIPIDEEPSKKTTIQFSKDKRGMNELNHVSMAGFSAALESDNFESPFHYNLSLGDALIFGDFVLHRSHCPEFCEIERKSLEFRLIQPIDAIDGKDYFDVLKGIFVKKT